MRKRSTFVFTAFVTIIAVVCIVFAAISFFGKKDGITLTKDQNMSLDYFIEYTDLSPEQLAALFSFIETNSKFDPTAEILNDGFGLCQWSFGRRTNLEAYANSKGVSPSDIDTQIEFLIGEITPGGGANGYATYQLLNYNGYSPDDWINATTPEDAAIAFCWSFERPGIPRMDVRTEAARRYYEQFKSN